MLNPKTRKSCRRPWLLILCSWRATTPGRKTWDLITRKLLFPLNNKLKLLEVGSFHGNKSGQALVVKRKFLALLVFQSLQSNMVLVLFAALLC